jgi:hypothetical protein
LLVPRNYKQLSPTLFAATSANALRTFILCYANCVKNKSFYFWWKIHASATSFSTKNKTFTYSNVLKVDDLEAGKSEGNRQLLK